MTAALLWRSIVVSTCLAVSAVVLTQASTSEAAPPRLPLAGFPMRLPAWDGTRSAELDPAVAAVLGADEYISRVYRSSATASPVGLFIAYYASQRDGDSMHSPLNCLPGSGWQPVTSGRERIAVQPAGDRGANVEVNRYVVEKNGERMLVLYWYHSQGRTVASEYWGKFYMVLDAIRTGRTDAALVRVMVPIASDAAGSEDEANRIGERFVQTIFAPLGHHLPA